jgi:hypothetical protein
VKCSPCRSEISCRFRLIVFFSAILSLTSNAFGTNGKIPLTPSTINFGSISAGPSQTQAVTLTTVIAERRRGLFIIAGNDRCSEHFPEAVGRMVKDGLGPVAEEHLFSETHSAVHGSLDNLQTFIALKRGLAAS